MDANLICKRDEDLDLARRRVLKEAEFNTKFLRPVRKIQRWYRRIMEARAAGKKKKKGGGKKGKGGGAKKGGKKKKK